MPTLPPSVDVAVNYCRHPTQKPRQESLGGASVCSCYGAINALLPRPGDALWQHAVLP